MATRLLPALLLFLAGVACAPAEAAAPSAPDAYPVTVETEDTLLGILVDLGFPSAVNAAAFQRGNAVWLVFSGPGRTNPEVINGGPLGRLGHAEAIDSDKALVLRFTGIKTVPTLDATGFHWRALFGNGAAAATGPSLQITPRSDQSGRMQLVAEVGGGVGPALTLTDPDAGDQIIVLPVAAAGARVVTGADLPELRILPTGQGLALLPKADGVSMAGTGGEAVISMAGRSLSVSDTLPFSQVRAGAVDARLDVGTWAAAPMGLVRPTVDETARTMMRAVALGDPATRVELSFRLGRYLIAQGRGAEVIGLSRVMLDQRPELAGDPGFHLMRGIALAMARRCDEALKDLEVPALEFVADAAVWRGTCYADAGRQADAAAAFGQGRGTLGHYAGLITDRLLAAIAANALAQGDLVLADKTADMLSRTASTRLSAATAELLKGQLAQRRTDYPAALVHYQSALDSQERGVRVDSELGVIDLSLRKGVMSRDDAIARLQRLRYAWRGDDKELEVLKRLASLELVQGRWRDGMDTLKIATDLYPAGPVHEMLEAQEREVFSHLFLQGGAELLPPVEAVALYYDYRDLTPLGNEGDEMIRRLADRLASVELVSQAERLLDHQVRTRLSGIPQAQVAARLALLHLVDQDPTGAIAVLDATDQPLLPDGLAALRRRIRARALADLGRGDQALALLATDPSVAGAKLGAEIAWDTRDWPQAAAYIGRVFDADPPRPDALTPEGEGLLLRIAVARSLSNDRAGLADLRQRYGAAMRSRPSADAFDMLVGGGDLKSLATRNLAQTLANASGFKSSFVDDMRQKMISGSLSAIN